MMTLRAGRFKPAARVGVHEMTLMMFFRGLFDDVPVLALEPGVVESDAVLYTGSQPLAGIGLRMSHHELFDRAVALFLLIGDALMQRLEIFWATLSLLLRVFANTMHCPPSSSVS